MLNISPFYLESASGVYADFFESRLNRERMSTLGHWQGRGTKLLGLKNPVELKALENLLNGRTPDGTRSLAADAGDPRRIAGWRIAMTASPLLNNVWAVAPREAHVRMERGFVQGVNRTLKCLEDVVTGVGTLAPSVDSPQAIMTVFRTNAAWDTSAELQATALLVNVSLSAAQKNRAYIPSQIMSFEGGLRDYFERALTARLDAQISQLKSYGSKRLRLNELVQNLAQKVSNDADSRSTWARRDDRGIWDRGKNAQTADWRQTAVDIGRLSQWAQTTDLLACPREVFAEVAREFRNRRHQREMAQESLRAAEQQRKMSEAKTAEAKKQEARTSTKKSQQFHGHSH